jgi:Lrp/AsnC family transcriptional regulator, leucine-responsive regulatory protein
MEHLNEPLTLDALDLKILDQLQIDASQSNQALAERVHISPPTCLRRVKRLTEAGLIERQIAILSADKLKPLIGHGLTAIVEVTLTEQNDEVLQAFEARISPEPGVQQCYRVSSGPDFILILQVRDMGDYLALVQRVFTSDAQVRNVKAFFSVLRSKFEPRLPLKPPVA